MPDESRPCESALGCGFRRFLGAARFFALIADAIVQKRRISPYGVSAGKGCRPARFSEREKRPPRTKTLYTAAVSVVLLVPKKAGGYSISLK